MAFITRIRMEGAGESPDAIRGVFDELCSEIGDSRDVWDNQRIGDEVYERMPLGEFYKGRRVVWFVEPGGANDPNAGKP